MNNAIDPIVVTLGVGGGNVTRVGFGIPIIAGFTGSRSLLTSGSGQAQVIFKSVERRSDLTVTLTEDASYGYTLTAGSPDLIDITYPAGATVRELIADFDANAGAPVKALLSLETPQQGLGDIVPVASATALVPLTYTKVLSILQIQRYYDTTDPEHIMLTNMFNSAPRPTEIYLLDVFGSADPAGDLASRDNGDWFFILTTSVTETEFRPLINYIVTVKRMGFFTLDDIADVVVRNKNIVYVIHDQPNDHPEASWVALRAPEPPGATTWAYAKDLAGQEPNISSSANDIIAVRDGGGNSYVTLSGLKYMDEGLTSEDGESTYIDQIRFRYWVEINLSADLLSLLVNNPNKKVPYTNTGINQVVGVIAKRLEIGGDNGGIRPIESVEDSEKSSGVNYVYQVTAPTRADIANSSPGDISARQLNGVEFNFEGSDAIHGISVSGTVIIPT